MLIFSKKWLRRPGVVLFLAAAAAGGGYLFASYLQWGIGYPLDDAWIHQTYARNLAYLGEWAFIPGQPSAGSTSPLWSALLAFGYWLQMGRFVPAFVLGVICLWGIGVLGEKIFRIYVNSESSKLPWMGLLLVIEWHLVWASVSGMETLLYALGIVTVFYLLLSDRQRWFLSGLLIGATVWLRPDGITMLGPALFVLFFGGFDQSIRQESQKALFDLSGVIGRGIKLFIGVGIVLWPYLIFNKLIAGSWLPNTFYAKQAEYAQLLSLPLSKRFLSLFSLPLVGIGVLLLPGVVYFCLNAINGRRRWGISAILWWLGMTLIYAMRLPVVYQHGRYLMPVMPMYFLLGGIGLAMMLQKDLMRRFPWRVLRSAWMFSLALVSIAFYVLGARAYAQDVAIIETEMVATADWIAENTPPEALIAAHDIGALGYFGQRELLDLAGLVSPEVIPFLRDEEKLADFITEQNAEYLVTFPDWYPELVENAKPVYQSHGVFAPRLGKENMRVYLWLEQ